MCIGVCFVFREKESDPSTLAVFSASFLFLLRTTFHLLLVYLNKHTHYFYFRCAAGYTGNPQLGQRCTVGNEVNGSFVLQSVDFKIMNNV